MTKAEPVVKITGIDEHGPLLGWYRHWADFPIGTEFYAASPAGAEVVYGPYPVVWIGAGVWAGIQVELPPELYGRDVYLVTAPPTPSTAAVRRQAREALLSEILRIIDSEEGAALVLRDMARNHQDREAAVIRGAEAAAIANLRPRIRALSTPPAGADEGGANGG